MTVSGTRLGKAGDIVEARAMWRLVTSAPNKITSSVAIVCQALNHEAVAYDNAFVTFKPYDEQAVEAYLATNDWRDKAGAWSIQQCRPLMETITGDEETILGLPTKLLSAKLTPIQAWPVTDEGNADLEK